MRSSSDSAMGAEQAIRMNPSYVRMRRPLPDAMARYGAWIGTPELVPPQDVAERDSIDLAMENGEWRGLAVYVFASGEWTVFQEVSGGLAAHRGEDWVRLADGGDLVFAGYNDAIGYGELVKVERGRLVRQFLHDEQDPGADVNVGRLPEEAKQSFVHWADVATWVEEDAEFTISDRGLLWIHQGPG